MAYEISGYCEMACTKPIVIRNAGNFGGILAWAKRERDGKYARIMDVGFADYVQGVAQSSNSGNFASKDDAVKAASKAYRWINKR